MIIVNNKKILYLSKKKITRFSYQKNLKKETNLNFLCFKNLLPNSTFTSQEIKRVTFWELERNLLIYSKLKNILTYKFLINFPEQFSSPIKTLYALTSFRKQVLSSFLKSSLKKQLLVIFQTEKYFSERISSYKIFYKFLFKKLKTKKLRKKNYLFKQFIRMFLIKYFKQIKTKKNEFKGNSKFSYIRKNKFVIKFQFTSLLKTNLSSKHLSLVSKKLFSMVYSILLKRYIRRGVKITFLNTLKVILKSITKHYQLNLTCQEKRLFFNNLIKKLLNCYSNFTELKNVSLIKQISWKYTNLIISKLSLTSSKSLLFKLTGLDLSKVETVNKNYSFITNSHFLKQILPIHYTKKKSMFYSFNTMTSWMLGRISNYQILKNTFNLKHSKFFKKPNLLICYTPITDIRLQTDHLDEIPQLNFFTSSGINLQLIKYSVLLFFRLWYIKPFQFSSVYPLFELYQRLTNFNLFIKNYL